MDLRRYAEGKKESIRSGLKKMGWKQWMVCLLLGVLMAVAAMPVSHDKKQMQTDLLSENDTAEAEKTQMEEKLEILLESVEGVGKVQVILMTDEKKNSQGFYGSGGMEVTGVLIAAQGGDDAVVVQNIQQAVMALFQVEAHKIKVMKMK